MSKFLRRMTALSKKPTDYQKPVPAQPQVLLSPEPDKMSTVATLSTVDTLATVDKLTTVDILATVDSLTTVDKLKTANSSAVAFDIDGNPVDPKLCKPANLVQHAHTPGEHAAYMALWNLGGTPDRKDEYRDVSIGYDKLAALIGGSKRNVQRLVDSLIRKLALEILRAEDSGIRQGKTYRVFAMGEILKRRREAGYIFVIRNRSAVDLARMPAAAAESPPEEASLSTVDKLTTVDSLSTDTVVSLSTDTVDSLSTPLGSILGSSLGKPAQRPSSSHDHCVVAEAVRKEGVILDDDAARRMVIRCRSADRSATADKIAHFAALKVRQLAKRRNIENWPGLLLAAVPAFFDSPATELQRYREAKRQESAEQEHIARQVLDDPTSTDQERKWARSLLPPAFKPPG